MTRGRGKDVEGREKREMVGGKGRLRKQEERVMVGG